MKLTRLRLLGFKSFVEPTDFLIEPGLTGVVGPNGCGKSNLVEALRWVMGETSHKSLRAADMDDVIFAGTNTRPGRNNAEVAIQIDNSARKAPAQFNEHETLDISRRIEREAGSTYRINGREVRARDVHILFADASTGSRSPSMVHQGRIGEIIQAKPEQRRRVLEEAAGISGLHARRHEAELRLRGAEQNLARLEDVINQLAAQIDALKRQARQAIRYRAVAQQVRKAEATLFHLRWVAANAELAEAEQAKNGAVRLVAERTGEQAEASKRQALAAAELPALREAEAGPPPPCNGWSWRARRSNARRRAPRSAWPSSTGDLCSSGTTSSASGGLPPMRKPRWRGSPPRKTRCSARPAPTKSGARASTSASRRPTPCSHGRKRPPTSSPARSPT